MKFTLKENKRQYMIKKWYTLPSIGLYAIRSDRIKEGKIVEVEKDKYGFYWKEDWQLSRSEDEEHFECWKLEY